MHKLARFRVRGQADCFHGAKPAHIEIGVRARSEFTGQRAATQHTRSTASVILAQHPTYTLEPILGSGCADASAPSASSVANICMRHMLREAQQLGCYSIDVLLK